MTNQIQLPGYQDYLAALKNPQHFLIDLGLKSGEVVLGKRNRPISYSGNFALTVPFIVDQHQYAIRCFLHLIPGIAERYAAITDFVKRTNSEVLVDIEYQEEGILVNGSRYAICKMEWVDGLTLDKYIEGHLDHPAFLTFLPTQFIDLVQQLHALGCAHGDLQHGNIIADGTRLRLVDYDGMFVPAFENQGLQATEIGHQNYQHPLRNSTMFHTKLDRFSSIAIFLSLKVIEHDPEAYDFDEDGAIYLKKEDFANPDESKRIQKIAEIGYPVAAQYFRNICKDDINRIPDLITFIQEDEALFDDLPGKTRRDISKGVAVVQRKKTTSAPKPVTSTVPKQKSATSNSQTGVTSSTGHAQSAFQNAPAEVPSPGTSTSKPSSIKASSAAPPPTAFGAIPTVPGTTATSTGSPANVAASSAPPVTKVATSPAPSQKTSPPAQSVPSKPLYTPPAKSPTATPARLSDGLRRRGVLYRTIALSLFFVGPWYAILEFAYDQDEYSSWRRSYSEGEQGSLFALEIILPVILAAYLANRAAEPILSDPQQYHIWRFFRATIRSLIATGAGVLLWLFLYYMGEGQLEDITPVEVMGYGMLLGVPFAGTIIFSANFGTTRMGKIYKTVTNTLITLSILGILAFGVPLTMFSVDIPYTVLTSIPGVVLGGALATLPVTIPVWLADRFAKGRQLI